MKVLVINCGSSSLKYQLIRTGDGRVFARGNIERIGIEGGVFTHQPNDGDKIKKNIDVKDHGDAMRLVLDALTGEHGVVKSLSEIAAVGHRFVNGGRDFLEPVLVNNDVLNGLRKILDIAPLHNYAHMKGIEASIAAMPDTPQVIVFDPGFHAKVKPESYMYAIPREYYDKYGIRKYGFHGTSHYYVSHRTAEILGRPLEELRLITCHLGNGCSIDAVRDGHAVEVSMGFTPLEGLVMGTRSGDIDPAAVLYIMKHEGFSPDEMDTILNKKSGLLAVSGLSSDMREVEEAYERGDEAAVLAINMFTHRIKKYIGSYIGVLGGVDAIVFTAGVGEHSPRVRKLACEGLAFLGIEIDQVKNEAAVGGEHDISRDGATVRILVVPTNEEIVIAREAERLCVK